LYSVLLLRQYLCSVSSSAVVATARSADVTRAASPSCLQKKVTTDPEQTASASSEFPSKQQFTVLLTEDAGCVLSGSDKCCYRTLDLMNQDMALA